LCYDNDTSEVTNETNVAVFEYKPDETFEKVCDFSENTSYKTHLFDYNKSFNLVNVDDNNVLVSRKDGIWKLQYNDTSYVYSLLQNSENNFFRKAVKTPNITFVINSAANGIERINNNNFQVENPIRSGFSGYHITANENGSKLYIYNKLNCYNTGLIVYDATTNSSFNINNDTSFLNDVNTPVGSIVYNGFQNHFLISKFQRSSATILVLNDDEYNSYNSSINLGTNVKYVKEMYLAPNGKLYVLANMYHHTDSTSDNPTLFIYDATNYNLLKDTVIDITGLSDYTNCFAYYAGRFDYNPEQQKVFALIDIQDEKLLPYNSEISSIYQHGSAFDKPSGQLLIIDGEQISKEVFYSDFPIKAIAPESQNNNGDNNLDPSGKVFTIGEYLYVYDYYNNTKDSLNIRFADIAYNRKYNKIFAIHADSLDHKNNRVFEIYTIGFGANGKLVANLYNGGMIVYGQMAGIFYNPYNGKMYVYKKIDNYKLGQSQVALLSFDPADPEPVWHKTELGIKSYFYDYDQHYDEPNGYYYLNLTTPYIDPYQNKIYLPNGGHSNVSVVSFTPDEQLTLNPVGKANESFTWVSFPRLTSPSPTVNTVLGGDNIVPNTYPYNYNDSSYLENLPLGETYSKFNNYDGSVWPASQDLQNINSTLGYKLSLKYNTNPNQQIKRHLHGNVLSPSASINKLYADKENWIGYWLYQQQDIFEALGATADELNLIKHQDWTCVKTYDHFGPGGSSTIEPFWQCDNNNTTIKYGDMVVLKSDNEIFNFQWNTFGNPPPLREDLSPDYYTYDEKEDYKPVTIELDSGDHPQEIGAFVEDSCIGATALSSDDTMTVIRAYVENNNDTIIFQKYYGTKSTNKHIVDDYYVYNRHLKEWYKGMAVNNKGKDRFFVSFKQKKTVSPLDNDSDFALKVYPNPAQNRLTVEYITSGKASTTLEIFNITGKIIINLQTRLTAGMHQNIINTQTLKNGIYLLRLSTGNRTAVERFVINR